MFTLAAYLHRIDPFAVRLPDPLPDIRWYGLSYVAGFIAAYLLIRWLTKRGKTQLVVPRIADFIFAVALGTVIGGRLGYCIFYDPALLTQFTGDFPFWGVLMINKGGMASHGGLLGIIVGAMIFARRHGHSALHLIDLCALASGIGIFFGRIANFINGELVGRPAPDDLPWAVKFPQDILEWPTMAPDKLGTLTPIVERIGFEQLGVTGSQWQSGVMTEAGAQAGWVNAVLHRIVAVSQQHGEVGDATAAMLRDVLVARHPSQLYAAALEGALVFAALFIVWARPRKPGVIGGWWLLTYGAVRIFDEFFRLPDAHLMDAEYAAIGLSRGQLLSIGLLIAGALYMWNAIRRDADKLGGWATKPLAERS